MSMQPVMANTELNYPLQKVSGNRLLQKRSHHRLVQCI